MTAQNASQASLPYHQDLICSQTKVPWLHIDLSLVEPIQGISYLILINSLLKRPEVILNKFTTTDSVSKNLRQVFANQGVPKSVVPRNVIQLSFTLLENFFRDLNISLLLSA
ncbi:hypothetical protein ACTXT7_014896 [Hymenolepis weldensis]